MSVNNGVVTSFCFRDQPNTFFKVSAFVLLWQFICCFLRKYLIVVTVFTSIFTPPAITCGRNLFDVRLEHNCPWESCDINGEVYIDQNFWSNLLFCSLRRWGTYTIRKKNVLYLPKKEGRKGRWMKISFKS